MNSLPILLYTVGTTSYKYSLNGFIPVCKNAGCDRMAERSLVHQEAIIFKVKYVSKATVCIFQRISPLEQGCFHFCDSNIWKGVIVLNVNRQSSGGLYEFVKCALNTAALSRSSSLDFRSDHHCVSCKHHEQWQCILSHALCEWWDQNTTKKWLLWPVSG